MVVKSKNNDPLCELLNYFCLPNFLIDTCGKIASYTKCE
jgi:hypothetical protein